jgi:hypothetical protein
MILSKSVASARAQVSRGPPKADFAALSATCFDAVKSTVAGGNRPEVSYVQLV